MDIFPGDYTTKAFQHACLGHRIYRGKHHRLDPNNPENVRRKKKAEEKEDSNGKDEMDVQPPSTAAIPSIPKKGSKSQKSSIKGKDTGMDGVPGTCAAVDALRALKWKREPLIEYILTLPLCDDHLRMKIVHCIEETKLRIPAGKLTTQQRFKLTYAWNMAFSSRFAKDAYFPFLFESFARHCQSTNQFFTLCISPRGQLALGSWRKFLDDAITKTNAKLVYPVYLEMTETLIKTYRIFDLQRDIDRYNLLTIWVGARFGFADEILIDLPPFQDIWRFR